jgi:beta-lactamase superfamily II metal-dependent hydrolase
MLIIYPTREELFFYVEKFQKQDGIVLMDFIDSNEFGSFDVITQLNYNWERRPTMIEVRNYKGRSLREGVTYRMTRETILRLANRLQILEESLIIGFRIQLDSDDGEIFGPSKNFTLTEQFWRFGLGAGDTLPDQQQLPISADQVIVRNVGQGSWNEIASHGDVKLVFDIGTLWSTKASDIIRLISNRNLEYQRTKPSLILSHWDVDHYHFLLGLEDATIKSFDRFITRTDPPTLTARKAAGRFRILNPTALIEVAPLAPPATMKNSTALGHSYLTTNRDYILFNSYKNPSRNKCALGLTIRKNSKAVIFSGDYDYSQVSNHILPLLNFKCDHYLVVPHHGGKAGKFIYNHSRLNKLQEAVISVGKNPYKPQHPHSNNVTQLRATGFSVIRTDYKGTDHIISL